MESMKSRYNIQERTINEAKSSLYSSSSDDEEEFEPREKDDETEKIGETNKDGEDEEINNKSASGDVNNVNDTDPEVEDVNLETSVNNYEDNVNMEYVDIDLNTTASLNPDLDNEIKKTIIEKFNSAKREKLPLSKN